MSKMYRSIYAYFSTAILLTLTACPPPVTPQTRITLGPSNPAVVVGAHISLTASSNDPLDTVFTWSSDDGAIAAVDAAGEVTGKAAGQTTIRARGSHSGKSGSTSVTVTAPACVDCVTFEDSALESAVRAAIGKPQGQLVRSDVQGTGFVSLKAPQSGIENLAGLEACTDLVLLDLHGNCIADIAPLSALTKLKELNLHDNHIADVSPLQPLTALELLWLSRNSISSIGALSANTGLGFDNTTNRRDLINLGLNPPNDSMQADIAALEARGAFVSTVATISPPLAPCSPADAADDPIPVSVSLVHGDPQVPDDRAYVIVFLAEAFPLEELGDPRQLPAVLNGSQRPYSEAIADTVAFFLSEQPFKEYAAYLKIYRVDLISKENRPTDLRTDPPTQRDSALRFGRRSVGFDYDQALLERIATNTGIDWDKISVLVNGDGSGTEAAGSVVFSNVTVSRRVTALHEFGHGIGNLGDEYEFRHGTDPPESYPPATVLDEPNVVATGTRIPLLAEIPWRHWLQDSLCDEAALGLPVDFECVQTDQDNCQCELPPMNDQSCVPLPTCEPGGDVIDANGIYGRLEWPEPGDADSIVGLYEGAKYRHKGAYRPELRCRMRSIDDVPERELITPHFCTVCREALVEAILRESGSAAQATPDPSAPVAAPGSVQFQIVLHEKTSETEAPELLGWSVDGGPLTHPGEATFTLNTGALSTGTHKVSVSLHDSTPWIHPMNEAGQQAATQTISWEVKREP